MRMLTVFGVVAAALLAPTLALGFPRAKSATRLTLYTVAQSEQYANYSDDRQRGYGSNPFGNFKDTTATIKKTKAGPFPGDLEYFQLTVYKDAALKKRYGTAQITCQFNINKNAFCDATYELNDGTLVGAGTVDFKSSSFALAVLGGTGKYRRARGVLESTPAANRAQRVSLDLT